jgi:aquaporin Z
MNETATSQDPTTTAVTSTRIALAEAFGTCVLMLVGPGSAILAAGQIGILGVALAFGVALTIMAYAIGGVSGCHINPAVTVGLVLAKKLKAALVPFYIGGQLVGALVGGLILWIATEQGDLDQTGVFASNGWGDTIGSNFGLGSTAIVEIVFTALLIFVVLTTTQKGFTPGMGGLTAGLTLAGIHLATIPVDNTSVNPARSVGAAVFGGGDHLTQMWAFIVFPLVGAVVGFAAWKAVAAADD